MRSVCESARTALHECLPVASDSLQGTIISSEWDVESDKVLAGLDDVEFLAGDSGLLGGFVVEKLNLLEETWLAVGIELGTEFGLRSGAECHCCKEEG